MNYDLIIEGIGYLAGVCTAIAQFPQAYKVYKTKDTSSISLSMYSLLTFSIVLWFTYGVLRGILPMMLANGVCLIPAFYTLFIAIRNARKKEY